jgi:hypothetical protein
MELIDDTHYELGFTIYEVTPGALVPAGVFQWNPPTVPPRWGVAQWASRYNLAKGILENPSPGVHRFSDTSMSITVGAIGTEEEGITMAMDSREEWINGYRTAGQPWPHLLIQQGISIDGGLGPVCPPLNQVTAVTFRSRARLVYGKRFQTAGYDPGLHAAQFQVFFTIQNLNYSSAGYGDFLWFGIPFYDDRWETMPDYVAGDAGTGKLIYTAGSVTFMEGTLHDGEWHVLQADLYARILDALNQAWERGFLQASRNLADYRLSGMNMGWEVPGINQVSVHVSNLSLTVQQDPGTSGVLVH